MNNQVNYYNQTVFRIKTPDGKVLKLRLKSGSHCELYSSFSDVANNVESFEITQEKIEDEQ